MSPTDRERPSSTPPAGPAPDAAEADGQDPPAAPPPVRAGEEDEGSVPESVRQKLEAWVPDLVRKAFTAGMGAVLGTEEGIRKLTKEMPMPKDVAGYLVNTASSTKDDLLRIIAREVREFLSTVNLSEEIAKMLTMLSFEVKTEIRFIPNDEKYAGVEPDVKARVRLKRAEPKATPAPGRRMFRRRRRGESGTPAEGE
ncbi:MAG TPA: hypothetical protein VFU21_14660 [Kofleriaceae bacterium]|nr:hypothetical protein [Kofleriaceae bacterium]